MRGVKRFALRWLIKKKAMFNFLSWASKSEQCSAQRPISIPVQRTSTRTISIKKWPFKVGLTRCVSFVLALCTAANCMLRREGLSFAYDKCPWPAPSPPATPNTHLFMCTSGSRALHHGIAPELFKTCYFKVKCMVKSSPKRQVTPACCLGSGQCFLSWQSQKGGRQAAGTPELLLQEDG